VGLYRVSGWFVNHEFRYTGSVELVVERDVPPSDAEAEEMLWPLADAQLVRTYPEAKDDSLLRNEFTSVDVRAQP
jgi:hypothetical protein